MNVNQIKEKFTCLDYLGKPLKITSSGWHIYRCPWKEDKNPSLNVSPDGKVWHDQSTGAKGGIIQLVEACLNTKDLSRVCAEFNSFSFSPSKTLGEPKEKESTFAFCDIVPLQNRALYAYLGARRINTTIAKQFLKEAHYGFEVREDGRYLFALAYANNLGGYELRGAPNKANTKGYKGGTAPKGITTHMTISGAPVVVFEGFMDMLSFATLCKGVKHNYVVLNSVSNKESAIGFLRDEKAAIYLCLDNDEAGDITTKAMLGALPTAADIRRRFAPHKDVNDYLCHLPSV